mmetsp:Transcript_20078/g.55844  ORF Transcript_20078/g.55844 Transcript_20078/m.55844 type:complete len:221 (+) Transcript_20078:2098-2760(+)
MLPLDGGNFSTTLEGASEESAAAAALSMEGAGCATSFPFNGESDFRLSLSSLPVSARLVSSDSCGSALTTTASFEFFGCGDNELPLVVSSSGDEFESASFVVVCSCCCLSSSLLLLLLLLFVVSGGTALPLPPGDCKRSESSPMPSPSPSALLTSSFAVSVPASLFAWASIVPTSIASTSFLASSDSFSLSLFSLVSKSTISPKSSSSVENLVSSANSSP